MVSILEYWISEWTGSIRDDIRALELEPAAALLALARLIRHRDAAGFDAPVRAWAMSDPLAAKYVSEADKIRLGFIKSLFKDAGFNGLELETRARMFLYYEAFEPMMLARHNPKQGKEMLEIRHKILTS